MKNKHILLISLTLVILSVFASCSKNKRYDNKQDNIAVSRSVYLNEFPSEPFSDTEQNKANPNIKPDSALSDSKKNYVNDFEKNSVLDTDTSATPATESAIPENASASVNTTVHPSVTTTRGNVTTTAISVTVTTTKGTTACVTTSAKPPVIITTTTTRPVTDAEGWINGWY